MKKVISMLLAFALCFGLLAVCTASSLTAKADDGTTVTIWHDGSEAIMQTIADQVNAALADDGITVRFEKKTDMPNQLKL